MEEWSLDVIITGLKKVVLQISVQREDVFKHFPISRHENITLDRRNRKTTCNKLKIGVNTPIPV